MAEDLPPVLPEVISEEIVTTDEAAPSRFSRVYDYLVKGDATAIVANEAANLAEKAAELAALENSLQDLSVELNADMEAVAAAQVALDDAMAVSKTEREALTACVLTAVGGKQ